MRSPRYLAIAAAVGISLCACQPDAAVRSASTPTPTGEQRSESPSSPPSPSRPVVFTDKEAWTVDFNGNAGEPANRELLKPLQGGNGQGNNELEAYTDSPRNASLDGKGHLIITARRETYTGTDGYTRNWTSARLTSMGLWSFKTGSLSTRMKAGAGTGLWPALWLLGTDVAEAGWPAAGEIDVVESLGKGTVAYQSLHGPTLSGKAWAHTTYTRRSVFAATAYHVYSVTRRPKQITFSIDGVVTDVVTPRTLTKDEKWVFDRPMFVIVNLAVGGNWPGPPNATTPKQSSVSVDWMRYTP